MTGTILGWDVGGANLKVACLPGGDPGQLKIVERPFALWREPECLPRMLTDMAATLGSASAMGLTMTAELADCFPTKQQGVSFVLDSFEAAFPGVEPWVYCVDGRFRDIASARTRAEAVAAANWMASATFVSRRLPNALFVDVGSTTTDIIPIVHGRVAAIGRTDPERLCTGELVYTGALRTPVCAIVRSVPLRGRRCRVAAEHFAIAADAHVWLGHIATHQYTCETPDGRGVERGDAAARLARVVCGDRDMLDDHDITAIARAVTQAQLGDVVRAMQQVIRRGTVAPDAPVACAGSGAFLAERAAERCGLRTHDVGREFGAARVDAIPAAAVAFLLAEADGAHGGGSLAAQALQRD